MALPDTGYRPYEGRHEGVWHRRWAITSSGLAGCLQNRWSRYLLGACWLAALVQVAVLFCIGQLLVADSIVVLWASGLNPTLQVFVRGLVAWLEQHPEISVRVAENLLFYRFATLLLPGSLVAVALAIPHLVTRDLSSHALVIYASKAVNRWDYVLGKAGVVLGLLALTWLGPVTASWFLGNLLAPNWHFFWHGRGALAHCLVFIGGGMLVLGLLGLALSAVSAREKAAIGLYVLLWLVGNALVPIGNQTQPWLRQFSVQYNVRQLAVLVFRPARDLKTAQDNIPVLGDLLRPRTRRGPVPKPVLQPEPEPAPAATGVALGILCVLSAGLLWWRVRPE